MANAVTFSRIISTVPFTVQHLRFSIDTDATVLSKKLIKASEPDMVLHNIRSGGSDAVIAKVTIDTTDNEVDASLTVETSGTLGTNVVDIYCIWFSALNADPVSGSLA